MLRLIAFAALALAAAAAPVPGTESEEQAWEQAYEWSAQFQELSDATVAFIEAKMKKDDGTPKPIYEMDFLAVKTPTEKKSFANLWGLGAASLCGGGVKSANRPYRELSPKRKRTDKTKSMLKGDEMKGMQFVTNPGALWLSESTMAGGMGYSPSDMMPNMAWPKFKCDGQRQRWQDEETTADSGDGDADEKNSDATRASFPIVRYQCRCIHNCDN